MRFSAEIFPSAQTDVLRPVQPDFVQPDFVQPDFVQADFVQAATGDRAGQVGQVLLIGLGVVVGLAAFAVLAYWLGRAFGWMVEKRWPVILYAVASLATVAGGYITESVALYYGIGALILPVLLLMFLAMIGF